mmetsp:Transcript_53780/g.136558  ORF Transcript_53780/g.136558 Transcript_53780/m.136558 type:complete len:258 (-) Transcript_53780:197-970(-)
MPLKAGSLISPSITTSSPGEKVRCVSVLPTHEVSIIGGACGGDGGCGAMPALPRRTGTSANFACSWLARSWSRHWRNMPCGIDCTARESTGSSEIPQMKVFWMRKPSGKCGVSPPHSLGVAQPDAQVEAPGLHPPRRITSGQQSDETASPTLVALPIASASSRSSPESSGKRTGEERNTTGSASTSSASAQPIMNVFFTLYAQASDATGKRRAELAVPTSTLKRCNRRSAARPKLSHFNSGCFSASFRACLRCPVVM